MTKQDDMLFQTVKYHMYDFARQSKLIPIAMELLNNPLFEDIVLWENDNSNSLCSMMPITGCKWSNK